MRRHWFVALVLCALAQDVAALDPQEWGAVYGFGGAGVGILLLWCVPHLWMRTRCGRECWNRGYSKTREDAAGV